MQRASGDVPGGQAQLCNDPPGSTSSIADAELCPRTPCEPERSELSVVCTDWAVKAKQEEIWNSDVSVKTNRKQDAAIMQMQGSKFCSQLRPSESNRSAGKTHSVVH